jgi:flagellar biosynthesis GTPase FlhF
MQKITITAPTLNEAIDEVKKRFGEDVVIERTEEINNQIRITVALFEGEEPILVPSLRNTEKNSIDNPLSAIRLVEEICHDHYLGDDFKDYWLKCLSPYLTLTGINIAESLAECLNFEGQWIRKILNLKPVVFLGSHGVGKTQILAKTAALLKACDRSVEIYNFDTLKSSGQGMLQSYAQKLGVPYYFGQDAWKILQESIKVQNETVKLIDTQGVDLKNPKDLGWLVSYGQKFVFDPVLIVPCDGCLSLTADYGHFIKKFGVRHIILSKMDLAGSLSLPLRLAWTTEIPIAMVNNSASLSMNLQYLNASKLLSSMTGTQITGAETDMTAELGMKY